MSELQVIDYYPVIKFKHLKGPLYEGYMSISDEEILLSKHSILDDLVRHTIADYGSNGYFVKRVYMKYYVMVTGIYIIAFEVIKLRPVKIDLGMRKDWLKN